MATVLQVSDDRPLGASGLHINPLNESFQCYVNRFALSLTIFEIERVKVGEWGSKLNLE